MTALVFDIETNGLLNELDRVHCLVTKDVDTGDVTSLNGSDIGRAVKVFEACDATLIGHNVIGFDCPALTKVCGVQFDQDRIVDTMVLSKLYMGTIKEEDEKRPEHQFPKKLLFSPHALKTWGYRLGLHKGDYDGGWDTWNEAMQSYCELDVEVTSKLWEALQPIRQAWNCPLAEKLEHDAAWLCSKIERNGVVFDTRAAAMLYSDLCQVRATLLSNLKALFAPWCVPGKLMVPRLSNKKTCITKDAPFTYVTFVEFNPSSRMHIERCFKVKYAWQPEVFTREKEAGDDRKGMRAKIDETILSQLPFPEAKQLAKLFLIEKRIAMLAEGKEAWLKAEKNGRIHGRINPNGAVTGRATHSTPNMSQVPAVDKPYGHECRALFGTIPGWSLFGVDASGLELRCLAHFMARWDGGAYGRAVVEGVEADGTDVHSLNAKALGLDPQRLYVVSGKQEKGRQLAKRWCYAWLYGAGDKKLAKILGCKVKEALAARTAFLAGVPALAKLKEALVGVKKGKRLASGKLAEHSTGIQRGYLLGLDRRRVHVRSEHAALNTLLQSAGAIICKAWMIELERLCQEAKLIHKHGEDGHYAMLLWVHDELQIACQNHVVAELIDTLAKEAMKNVERLFDFKVPLDCSGKVGANWAETH